MVKFKKKSPHRWPHEKSGLKRIFITLAIVFGCAVVLMGFWGLSRFGPQDVDARQPREKLVVSAEAKALRDHSIELEDQSDKALARAPTEARGVELLKQALALQVQYIAALPNFDSEADQRRIDLDKRYQELGAVDIRDKSLDLEAEAQVLADQEDYAAARVKCSEAFDGQAQINENFPLSGAYDVGRAIRLQRQLRYLTAEPILQQSLELEDKAEGHAAEREWEQAAEVMQQAMALQYQLNREYRGTTQASVARLERLTVNLVEIRSGQSHLEVKALSDLADTKRLEGETLEAASLYQGAARLQKQLSETYPLSPFASSDRVLEFQRKSQSAQSFELGSAIENNHDLLKSLLSARRTYEAAEVVVALRRDLRQMEEAFPRSSLNDEELQVKVRYLNLVQSDLGFVQDGVYAALLPIPGEDGWRMLRTEVPQALYALIMGTNPSRNQGDVNPVDSVSWVEVKRFCERLSWIMGKRVRLPTENEFRQALGPLRYVVLDDHVWSVSDADGIAQPVGQKMPFSSGFYDLLGNVSEWLESTDRYEAEDARHIGGDAEDRLATIFTIPVGEAPRGERNRLTGFRLVVEVD
jgi:hypothetical protein